MTAVRACSLEQIRLFNFRNYAEATVSFAPGVNVITGSNAQGKTNLLEAVATLTLTRSPRASSGADLLRWETSECQVTGHILREPVPTDLAVRFSREHDAARVTRTTTVDGKSRPARAILGICPVVLFWPEDLTLVKAGPDIRRRRLDILSSQLDARSATDLIRFRRIVEQRNAVLRSIREGRGGLDLLPPFDSELAMVGSRIQRSRAALLGELSPVANAALRRLSGGADELQLGYRPDGLAQDVPNEDVFSDRLRRRRDEEIARGVTLVGPHRDDVEVELGGRPARTTASQGQQRSIVLALTLAEVDYIGERLGTAPVLLLDDVLSELDADRRTALLEALAEHPRLQVLVTSAEPEVELPRVARRLEVVGGTIHAPVSVVANG